LGLIVRDDVGETGDDWEENKSKEELHCNLGWKGKREGGRGGEG